MLPRILTILVGLPIIVTCAYWGGTAFVVLVTVLALASINEFLLMMRLGGHDPSFFLGNLFTVVFVAFFNLTLKHPNWEPAASGILTTAIVVTFSTALMLPNLKNAIDNIAITLLGCLYVGWLYGYLILIRAFTPHGMYLFFLLFIIWANDTAAYVVGSRWGKTLLSPVSPKKTFEGAVAGFFVSVVVAVFFGQMIHLPWWSAVLLGAIISVMGQMGDLVESMIKRSAQVKDSSQLVPGHGGVLDRMDSFIFAAPVVYYYLSWFVV